MEIELPKDAEGREIPLDTKVLYNEDGKCFKVNRFTYSVVQTMPGLKWGAVFMDSRYDYCSSFYLTPPETHDSWEKLEKDLVRASRYSNIVPSCRYFTAGKCVDCRMRNGDTCVIRKDERAFADIIERIRKLRGEDE